MSRAEPMDQSKVDTFLGEGGTAVLALAKDDESYAIPVSYGYDAEENAFYLRLALQPESRKRAYLGPSRTVSLVVSEETSDGWQSVVARGRLRETGEASLDSRVVESIHRVNIPFFGVFDRAAHEIDFEVFRLVPDELSGHKQV